MKNKCRKLIFLLFSSSRVDLFVKKYNCQNLSLIFLLFSSSRVDLFVKKQNCQKLSLILCLKNLDNRKPVLRKYPVTCEVCVNLNYSMNIPFTLFFWFKSRTWQSKSNRACAKGTCMVAHVCHRKKRKSEIKSMFFCNSFYFID